MRPLSPTQYAALTSLLSPEPVVTYGPAVPTADEEELARAGLVLLEPGIDDDQKRYLDLSITERGKAAISIHRAWLAAQELGR